MLHPLYRSGARPLVPLLLLPTTAPTASPTRLASLRYGSYNPTSEDIVNDAIFVPLLNSGTSLFAGTAIFSMLGFVASQAGQEIDEVVEGGEGLAFVVYPSGISQLAGSNFFGLAFFFMLFLLALDSLIAVSSGVVAARPALPCPPLTPPPRRWSSPT